MNKGEEMYKEICQKYAPNKDNLIQILHEIQDTHPQHYISPEAWILWLNT
jgi:NADH:ubiquinone oxidoreductase subunit E